MASEHLDKASKRFPRPQKAGKEVSTPSQYGRGNGKADQKAHGQWTRTTGEGNEDTSSGAFRPLKGLFRPHIYHHKGVTFNMKKFAALLVVAVVMAFAAPAIAANPFMDVPMNHWAYDAIGQLAASGVVNGYPDATFKGNQPMTRYEMATAVARALAVVDMQKASKQDVEMLKKLVVEFKDELDALGVKVDNIDSRLAVMEERLGGWKINGDFRMRMEWADEGLDGDNGGARFRLHRARLTFKKYIDENVSFTARLRHVGDTNLSGTRWDMMFIDVKLPWDITMRMGRQNVDYWDEEGLYVDNDSMMFDVDVNAVRFDREFGMGSLSFFIAHSAAGDTNTGLLYTYLNNTNNFDAYYHMGFKAKIAPSETWGVILMGEQFWFDDFNYRNSGANPVDQAILGNQDDGFHTYAIDAYVNFTPNIRADLTYLMQGYDQRWRVRMQEINGAAIIEDAPSAIRAAVSVKQEALGFTALRIEYTKFNRGWLAYMDPYGYYASILQVYSQVSANAWNGTFAPGYGTSGVENVLPDEVTTLFFQADQKWNEKWSSGLRYVTADMDSTFRIFGGLLPGQNSASNAYSWKTTDWTAWVQYNYTPGLSFKLIYDKVDYDDGLEFFGGATDDNLIRLQTHISF